ncbi:CHC2 zinc finger domain-containing protein [Patescibacteria group bacterium]
MLNRVDIVDVVQHYLGTNARRKVGKDYFYKCPFHDERTPSFSITQQKQFCHCFGCGFHANAIEFVMEYDDLSYSQAVLKLAQLSDFHIPSGKTKPTRARRRNRDKTRKKSREKNRKIMHSKRLASQKRKRCVQQQQMVTQPDTSNIYGNCPDDDIPF